MAKDAMPAEAAIVTEPLRVKCGSGLSDYRVLSGVVLVVFVVLYLIFR